MSEHSGRFESGLIHLFRNQKGSVFIMTLVLLLTFTSFLLWQIDQYNRDRLYLQQQVDLMELENLLQMAVKTVTTVDSSTQTIELVAPSGSVSLQKRGDLYHLIAELSNGKRRQAEVTVDKEGFITSYKEGFD